MDDRVINVVLAFSLLHGDGLLLKLCWRNKLIAPQATTVELGNHRARYAEYVQNFTGNFIDRNFGADLSAGDQILVDECVEN
jgi:hypothetical protein